MLNTTTTTTLAQLINELTQIIDADICILVDVDQTLNAETPAVFASTKDETPEHCLTISRRAIATAKILEATGQDFYLALTKNI